MISDQALIFYIFEVVDCLRMNIFKPYTFKKYLIHIFALRIRGSDKNKVKYCRNILNKIFKKTIGGQIVSQRAKRNGKCCYIYSYIPS